MSLKAELETWAAALKAYDEEDFEKSLDLFSRIADSSKILTNMGLIYATLGEHEAAVEQFIAATGLDQYLAVAYFQCGVSNFLLGRYELASRDFEEALLYLRGNQAINYTQLGLAFNLYSSEVLFNKGLSLIYMGQPEQGMAELQDAARQKATDEHNVIDEAIRDNGDGYTVFSIPVGVLYRPSENKLKNAKTRDFLGKAKLVAAEDANEAYTTFTGVTRLKQGITPSNVYTDDAPALNRSATVPARSTNTPESAPAPNLGRANTTINVATNIRERTSPSTSSPIGGPGASLARANTTITASAPSAINAAPRAPPSAGGLPPTRGLSVRKPGASSPTPPPKAASPPPPAKNAAAAAASSQGAAGNPARMTEFYDSYLDSYADSGASQPLPPIPPMNTGSSAVGGDRIAAWARSNANAGNAPPTSYSRAPSSFAGSRAGTLRRKPTRSRRGPTSAPPSTYEEEEEEGYVTGSGEWDEVFELVKIRIKIHFEDDVRGMAIDPQMPFEEFMSRVADKFELGPRELSVKFKDEDGGKVTLRDESDYELAIETARESAKGKPEGRLEMWCTRR